MSLSLAMELVLVEDVEEGFDFLLAYVEVESEALNEDEEAEFERGREDPAEGTAAEGTNPSSGRADRADTVS
jgi:hypothetical protein